ncbi:acyltransferase [Pseudolysobacter antarcticus]|uniref:Acyltransferase n=1 Tax=Pseudolysobacter antarcticus TaxID=2511995 RepID=A0A411HIR2_9GAMM|nr:acyltransferase [Pseudolysobacter antarcticus]QBB70395.1 acyltransferase [Pseudolysobacter antarcticus]
MSSTHDAKDAFGIELLQAIAIGLVVLAHGLMLALPTWPNLFVAFTLLSLFGIELLLLLAGFTIGAELIELLQSRGRVRDFWRQRAWRMLPNYYLFLVLACLLYSLLFKIFPGGWNYLWLGQSLLAPAANGFFPESWRIAIEVWFFLLAPLPLILIAQYLRDRSSAIPWFSLMLILSMPALRMIYILDMHPAWDGGLRKITLLRPDALAWGMLFCYWKLRNPVPWEKHAGKMAAAGFAILLPCAMYAMGLANRGNVSLSSTNDAIFSAALFSFLPAGLACLLPLLDRWLVPCSAGLRAVVSSLSRYSYALYFAHIPLLFVLLYCARDAIKDQPSLILFAGFGWIILSMVAAALVFRFFEEPLRRFGTARVASKNDSTA